jgi:hypothetical protein
MFKMIDCNVEWDGDKSATHYFVKENGFLILIPLSNNMHRIVLKTEKEEEFLNAEKLSTDEFQKLVNKYGGSNIKISNIIWKTEAPFYNRLIEKYREVRVFFAGDSSHLFSPIGGLGMNTGIQDAYNISWKLAGVIHKKYSEDILDTYESERRSIAKILIAGTDNTTKLIARIDKDTSSGIQNWLPVMSNRILMKVEYPLRFSGLGQCYTDMNGTIIRSIPYVSVIFKEKKEINSYHLVKGYIPIPLVFSRTKELRKIGKQNFIIVSDCEHENANDDFFIFDPDRKYYNAFNAKEGDVYLLRPDGYMKFLGQFNNDLELSNIFKVNFKEIFYDAA